jgi:hypothetical protein
MLHQYDGDISLTDASEHGLNLTVSLRIKVI